MWVSFKVVQQFLRESYEQNFMTPEIFGEIKWQEKKGLGQSGKIIVTYNLNSWMFTVTFEPKSGRSVTSKEDEVSNVARK